jgi:antitoxin component of RelBE/YafQ-DinJ toxin-antitoxin module
MPRTDRVYLRIDPELKQQVQEYCDKNHTTLSDMVTRFFVRLLEEERKKHVIDAEQI